MTKKSKIQEIPLNLDEESVEKSRFAGMLKRDIEAAASAVAAHKAKSAELSGDLSAKLENFVNKGGHKSALKAAEKIAGMEAAEAQDWMRSFQAYCDALGVNDQIDMFEQEHQNNLNMSTIAAASAGQPQFSEELMLN